MMGQKTVLGAFLLGVIMLLAWAAGGIAAELPRGKMTGGIAYELPVWFKNSFLEVRDDAAEAGAQNRHLLLFMHLADCPYCARLLDENFRQGETKDFLQQHFDVIAIDIRGSHAVEWLDGRSYTEKELADVLKVVGTPTLLFVDEQGKVVLRLNGYRQPGAFRQALEYVHGRHYLSETLAGYVERQNAGTAHPFRLHTKSAEMTDFEGYTKPLAVIFEDKDCTDCDEVYAKVLSHPDVQPELARFTVVRLDAYSTQPIIDLDGTKTTPKDWALRLNIAYRPGVVLFNEGKERARMEGMLYRFHFKELLRYVSGRHYQEYPATNQYNAARREELLKRGEVIDYSQ